MLYLANPCGERVLDQMRAGVLGYIDTPAQGNKRPEGVAWCADNGCFSSRFNEAKWWRFLEVNADHADTCLFATAPDVVGDADATIERSVPWLPKIRALGYPAAFVAQDGLTLLHGALLTEGFKSSIAWDEFDALFIGGTTDWKLGPVVVELVAEAKRRGKWVHMGRVNSNKRYKYAAAIGCDSADGTYLTFGPDVNLPKLLGWVTQSGMDLTLSQRRPDEEGTQAEHS